jgi:hypothetical protein
MGIQFDAVRVRKQTQVLATPHIMHHILCPIQLIQARNLFPHRLHRILRIQGVEHEDVEAFLGRANPVIRRMRLVPGIVLVDAPFVRHGRTTVGGILVESDEFRILQDVEQIGRETGQHGSDDQGRLDGGPHGEVRSVLLDRIRAHAHLQHVVVAVAPEVGHVPEEGRVVQNRRDAPVIRIVLAVPVRIDIAPHAPALARLVAPFVDVCVAPVAKGVEDRAVLLVEGVAHLTVSLRRVGGRPFVVCRRGFARCFETGASALVFVGRTAEPELGMLQLSYLRSFIRWLVWRCSVNHTIAFLTVNTPCSKSSSINVFVAE